LINLWAFTIQNNPNNALSIWENDPYVPKIIELWLISRTSPYNQNRPNNIFMGYSQNRINHKRKHINIFRITIWLKRNRHLGRAYKENQLWPKNIHMQWHNLRNIRQFSNFGMRMHCLRDAPESFLIISPGDPII
jgi:hypothetical protein